MKKITLIFTLILTLGLTYTQADDDFSQWEDKDSKKRWFFGLEGGAGLFDLGTSYLFMVFNDRNFGWKPASSGTSYFGRLTVGYQQYKSEKVGYRVTWAFGGFGGKNLPPQSGGGLYAGATIDGLFDFVRRDDKHFGILFGTGTDVSMYIPIKENMSEVGISEVGISMFMLFRLGFYFQTGNEIFELVGNIPAIVGVGMHLKAGIPVHSTLSLGYKHLF